MGHRPWCRILLTALVSLFLLVATACSSEGGSSFEAHQPVAPPRVGMPAPDFTVLGLDGKPVRLKDFRGRPLFLGFWATWCPSCREEMPMLEAAFCEGRKDFAFLHVSLGEDRATMVNFLKQGGYTLPVALDTDLKVGQRYGVLFLPTSFILDRQGVVRFHRVGPASSKEELLARLASVP